ncbi:SpoIIE family protein phosphatase [Actinomadura nitritigenes]|uniref:SpoIIE family protein phosphatase n=1 Tax=Actinomadura nitritigenes TaxID=134602 RepID=UPI003D8EE05D
MLPTATCCEAAEFIVACALVPADTIGGDTYDYTLDHDTLHLSMTDAMGHDVDAALLATLLVNASRGAPRRSRPGRTGHLTHQAMLDHGRDAIATGQLLRVSLDGTGAHLVIVLTLTTAVSDACGGHLQDDATLLCLDWHGPRHDGRHTQAGADT